jgi:hypothetical protein
MRRLPARLVAILNELVSKYHPEWLDLLQSSSPPELSWEQRDQLRSSCASELCETGLMDNDEPNERGYLLEELIDWLGQE